MPDDIDFRRIFESVPDCCLVLARDLRVVAATKAYLRATRMRHEEVLGRPLFDVLLDNAADPRGAGMRNLRASLERVLTTRADDAMAVQKYDVRREDGSLEERYWSPLNCPVLAPNGDLAYVIHCLEDVTDLVCRDGARDAEPYAMKRMELDVIRRGQELERTNENLRAHQREHAQFRLLVDSVEDYAIFMLDPEGRVASWNRGAERILGYRTDEILGAHIARFHTAEDQDAKRPEHELAAARRDCRFEEERWRVRKDGSRFWANVVITPIHGDGKFVGFAKVTRDLTARREAEEERVRLAQAREAVRLRDEFLSIASHELRTPLTALDLQVQSLLERRGKLDAKTEAKLTRIGKSSARLRVLIDALLDVSRIANRRFAMNPTAGELVGLVSDVIERLSERASSVGCEIILEKRVQRAMVQVDSLRMEQVLTNVLDNAFKFAPGKPVRVVVEVAGGSAVLTVIDQGPGIQESDRERVFGRFERAVPQRHFGGLGLGLYLSREIMTAHGGAITAGNDPAGGALITMNLPLASEQTAPEAVR